MAFKCDNKHQLHTTIRQITKNKSGFISDIRRCPYGCGKNIKMVVTMAYEIPETKQYVYNLDISEV